MRCSRRSDGHAGTLRGAFLCGACALLAAAQPASSDVQPQPQSRSEPLPDSAPGQQPDVDLEEAELQVRVKIRSIEWSGVHNVARAELRRRILSVEASWRPWLQDIPFDEATVEEDLDRITDFYRSRGYYSTTARYELEWNTDRTRVRIHFQVEEGIPVVLTSFEIHGLEHLESSADALAGLRVGLPLTADVMRTVNSRFRPRAEV